MAEPGIALVIVGHGSAKVPDSSRPTREHAEILRRSGRFAEVHVAFWKEEPFLKDILSRVRAPEIRIVPNLACKGYITGQVIPREMGLAGPVTIRNHQRIVLCDPVGSHPGIAETIAAKVRGVARDHGLDAGRICLLLIGHGTSRNPESAIQTQAVADRLAAMGLAAEVRSAFLEQEPHVRDWADITAAPDVLVMPFMISNGLHGAEDIPAFLGLDPREAGLRRLAADGTPAGPYYTLAGRRLWYLRAIGHDPAVTEIIAELAAKG
jgi:sirohydrochlorin cobaltochelatase